MPRANGGGQTFKCGKCGGHPRDHHIRTREIKTERGTFKLHPFVL